MSIQTKISIRGREKGEKGKEKLGLAGKKILLKTIKTVILDLPGYVKTNRV